MNIRAASTGILIMLAIAVLGIANDIRKSMQEPDGFYIDPTDRSKVALGEGLYQVHCASCHGEQLEGQPNWRTRLSNGRLPAPPHNASGHTWHHPDIVLFDITRNGMEPGRTAPSDYASDMPAYGGVLSDDEIVAVLAYIKSTWPADILALQDEVNRNAWEGGAR